MSRIYRLEVRRDCPGTRDLGVIRVRVVVEAIGFKEVTGKNK